MRKLMMIAIATLALTSCTKESQCPRLSSIDAIEHDNGCYIQFTYDNDYKWRVVTCGEDYSHLSDFDLCEMESYHDDLGCYTISEVTDHSNIDTYSTYHTKEGRIFDGPVGEWNVGDMVCEKDFENRCVDNASGRTCG